jgi:hypothetical protein
MKSFRLTYEINGNVVETYYFICRNIAVWKQRQLKNDGNHYLGIFKIKLQ